MAQEQMHPLFEVLRASVVTKPDRRGRVLFCVLGLDEERIAIDLGERITVESTTDLAADLTVFCDRAQLDDMLESGFSRRALRYSGDASLLDQLSALIASAKSPISIRGDAR